MWIYVHRWRKKEREGEKKRYYSWSFVRRDDQTIADTNMCAAPVAYVLHRGRRVYRFFFFPPFFYRTGDNIRLCYVTVTHEIHITALTRKTTRRENPRRYRRWKEMSCDVNRSDSIISFFFLLFKRANLVYKGRAYNLYLRNFKFSIR